MRVIDANSLDKNSLDLTRAVEETKCFGTSFASKMPQMPTSRFLKTNRSGMGPSMLATVTVGVPSTTGPSASSASNNFSRVSRLRRSLLMVMSGTWLG